jgi:hypothetical protein
MSSHFIPSVLPFQFISPIEYAVTLAKSPISHRIHGAAIYGNMDPINIPPMLVYIPAPWILRVSAENWFDEAVSW